jgi:organic hydroperoxide reductase OsmC/OhrA
MKHHTYDLQITWTGNDGDGTKSYTAYRRDHTIASQGKPAISASSDPAFRGNPARYNPEELLVASLSSCHMLWYLHLCATNHVVVLEYQDAASGIMKEEDDGAGRFIRVLLRPRVTIAAGSDPAKARALHREAHRLCFIANSVNFPIDHEPEISETRA